MSEIAAAQSMTQGESKPSVGTLFEAVFQGDVEVRDRCLEWLRLCNINPRAYTDQLEVLAGQMSPTKVNTHLYLGLGWKKQQEYTTIYLKLDPDLP
jgi:hypothetical protein